MRFRRREGNDGTRKINRKPKRNPIPTTADAPPHGHSLSNPAITAPIVGASRPEQLADSFAAAEIRSLPSQLKARLDEISHGWRAVDAER